MKPRADLSNTESAFFIFTDKTPEMTEQTKIKISPLIFAMMIFANINENGGLYKWKQLKQ